MTLFDRTSFLSFIGRVVTVRRRFGVTNEKRSAAPDPHDDARARRAFVQDMLSRNSQAFSSDQDVQFILQHYPGRF